MSIKELLLTLINAKNEKQVCNIIEKDPILSNRNNWKPYGGSRGNFRLIHNQQGNAIPALVEKPMNSIDALLIKECKLRGIDPESTSAPQSIRAAVEAFFKIKGGTLEETTETQRRKIAENIQIIAEGDKRNPNIIIYDYGEGQHPDDFEDTFVSLHAENKIKIKFVQGEYNMGGSGVLPNCGQYKYQLILSRKCLQLLNGKKDLYGFTLVRLNRERSISQYKLSWYEYCVDGNGDILNFPANETIDLGLHNRLFSSGTYIKLFNYDLPDKSNITLGLWRDLNRYLYCPALPILMNERRDYKGHASTKLMLGNRIRIMIDNKEMKETTFPMEINFSGAKFPVEVTVLKEDVNKNEFVGKLAVVFTYNGQVHDHLTNVFITSKAKLTYLSGYVIVNIDCSNIPTDIRSELFMASRDRMRDNTVARMLKEEIAKELKDHDVLRQLNEKRRDEKIFKNPKDKRFMEKIMNKLLTQNKDISKILGLNGSIISDFKKKFNQKKKMKEGAKFKPKRFPTFLKFKNIAPGNIKMLSQDGECKLTLLTDVEDEYLIRPKDKGELKVIFETPRVGQGGKGHGQGSEEQVFDVNVVGPSQGQIKVRIKAKQKLPVGSAVPVDIRLSSPSGEHIMTANVKIANPKKKAQEKEREKVITYSLPELIQVYKEKRDDIKCGWWGDPDYNWDDEDICRVFSSSSEERLVDAVAVNMDARVLHNYVRSRKLRDKNIEQVKRLYQVGIFLIALILFFQMNQREEIEDKEELLAFLMKGIGKIIIQVVINEEIIKEIEREE